MFSYKKFQNISEECNVTAYEVSRETGVATSTLTCWKNGKYTPKIDKIQKIAEFFNVPISYFLESEEEDYERSNDSTGNSITD